MRDVQDFLEPQANEAKIGRNGALCAWRMQLGGVGGGIVMQGCMMTRWQRGMDGYGAKGKGQESKT